MDFSPIYGTLSENKTIIYRGNKTKRGYQRNTVYCHGIPFSGKTYDFAFHCLGFRGRTFFSSSSKKPGATHILHVSKSTHALYYIHMTSNRARVTDPNNSQPLRNAVIKRTIGGSHLVHIRLFSVFLISSTHPVFPCIFHLSAHYVRSTVLLCSKDT